MIVLLLVLGMVGVVLFTKRPEVCPACLALEPYEGYNYYQCNECGHSWAKDTNK